MTTLWWKSKLHTYTSCRNDYQAKVLFFKNRFQDLPQKPQTRPPQQYKNVTMKFKDTGKTKYDNTHELFINKPFNPGKLKWGELMNG